MLPLLLALAACGADAPSPTVPEEKPRLALLTSLPLVFAEGFSLEASGSPALAALEEHWQVEPIAIADAASLDGHALLLMAHPQAQTAEALVELDAWVRGGGKVLLLADPKLEWQSDLPLGDRRRPPLSFGDTGLLGHWGLRLEGPVVEGPAIMVLGENDVLGASPGRLVATGEQCSSNGDGLFATCTLGEGRAFVIADADWIMLGEGGVDGPIDANLPTLVALLEALGD